MWEAPSGLQMKTKQALVKLYSDYFPGFEANRSLLHELFVQTVEVAPKCTWKNLVDEIRHFKESKSEGFDRISTIYGCLEATRPIAITKEEMRLV